VTEFKPEENKVLLSNGREYTYKALVLTPGFNHSVDNIEGLRALADGPEENNVFAHELDADRVKFKNYYHGWNHPYGDMICYSPKAPYKGEGNDFYAFYYEHFLR